jgi:hypothetical protein
MKHKVTCRTKKEYFNSTNGSKGKTQELIQKKKSHRGHGCLCRVSCKDSNMEHKVA